MKHNKVVHQWYEIDFSTSSRYLGQAIEDFVEGSPFVFDDENTSIMRDSDGDFCGVLLYCNAETEEIYRWICLKLDINYEDVKHLDFKLIG
jgi:hypothetical protein